MGEHTTINSMLKISVKINSKGKSNGPVTRAGASRGPSVDFILKKNIRQRTLSLSFP